MPDSDKKNVTSFKPGQSGNTKGRPPMGESMTDALRAAMTPDHRKKFAEKARQLAEQGDIRAMEFIADRIDGKPAQRQIITGDPDAPVAIIAGPRKAEKE